jgi:hypothetical protein
MVDQFFRTTVTASIAPGATTITVADASGFPVPTGNKYFYLTLVNENDTAEVVKIANVTGLTLTLWAGDAVQTGFAFVDMQNYILSLNPGAGGGYEPDNVSIGLNGLNELEIEALGVTTAKIANEAVTATQILNNTITNIKLATGIDAAKIASLASSKLPVDTIPQITFAQIDYDTGTPSGGSDGDIYIEWEDYVP